MLEVSAEVPSSGTAAAKAQQDILEQLLHPEVQQSLMDLIENLPKLAEMVNFLTRTYDFAQAVMTDQVLLDDLAGGMREMVRPVQAKIREYATAAIEAQERARGDDSTVGVFDLLRLLKDPQMQRFFHFMQAFLDVLGERGHRE